MGYKKIIVTQVQSTKIHRILKADTGSTPLQDFIELIVKEAEIEEWIAETFASAWRYNHRDNNETETETEKTNSDAQQTKEQKSKLYYVTNELPTKTAAVKDPGNGTGKVAQIIALAEQGKSTAEIIEMGFNKSTVYRQVSEWKKRTATSKEKKLAKA
jgi:hypothetical protein